MIRRNVAQGRNAAHLDDVNFGYFRALRRVLTYLAEAFREHPDFCEHWSVRDMSW